jgi:sec-independent protein translocase protein TatA
MPSLGYTEMIVFGMLALMLFGSKLPEVARSLGKTYRELTKSMNEFQREFQGMERLDAPPPPRYQADEPTESTTTAPRFVPPPADNNEA